MNVSSGGVGTPMLHFAALLQTPVPPSHRSVVGRGAVAISTKFDPEMTLRISPLPMFRPFVKEKVPVTKPPVVRNLKVSPTAGKKLSRLTFRVPLIRAFPETFK